MSTPNPAIEQALAAMLAALDDFLSPVLPPGPPPPPPPPGLPDPNLSLVSVAERTVGLGNRRGTDLAGPFAVMSLKGLRLEAIVRYQFWGGDPAGVDTLISALQAQLSAATSQLRAIGFLQITAEATSLADHVEALKFWRRTADFRVLFEFHYQDADGAEGIIARIPVEIDSGQVRKFTVTNDMTVWDDKEAPKLSVRRKHGRNRSVNALTVLEHFQPPPKWSSKEVTLTLITGETTTPLKVFPAVQDFLNAFELEPEIVTLGEKAYRAGRMEFPNKNLNIPAIVLSGDQDVFQISYDAPNEAPKFAIDIDSNTHIDSGAVVYLRVL